MPRQCDDVNPMTPITKKGTVFLRLAAVAAAAAEVDLTSISMSNRSFQIIYRNL